MARQAADSSTSQYIPVRLGQRSQKAQPCELSKLYRAVPSSRYGSLIMGAWMRCARVRRRSRREGPEEFDELLADDTIWILPLIYSTRHLDKVLIGQESN